ncbi:MAG: hypothetical protein H8E44_35640 [Planctomycetes bacterium]|nr:hypothetical protein [Planctomycetota bacterium]
MDTQLQNPVSSPGEVMPLLVRRLQGLVKRTPDAERAVEGLLDALTMLNALPLTTDEFGRAVNRLKNAHRYLVSNERGAARFELRLLLGSLKSGQDERPVRRRFRRQRA